MKRWIATPATMLLVTVAGGTALVGCTRVVTSNSPAPSSATVQSVTQTKSAPKTLGAATAAEQENADRYSSGDYAGQWLLYSRQLREAISQSDYVAYAKRCMKEAARPEGLTLTVEGVRMEGDDTAIVRVSLLGVKLTRTMVYEDGQWLQKPTDELTKNFGKPLAEWDC